MPTRFPSGPGKNGLFVQCFQNPFSYRSQRIKLTVDGLVMEFNSLLVAVTNLIHLRWGL